MDVDGLMWISTHIMQGWLNATKQLCATEVRHKETEEKKCEA